MAEWKKVVVSGSAISQLQNDSNYLVSGDSSVELTGSFKGDGSQLTGVTSDQTGEALTDGSGISEFTFDGSTAVSISVQNDGSTLTVGGGGVKVSDAGITATQLATSVAGDGLSGGAGTALSVNTDGTSITTSGDSLTLAGTVFSSSVDSRIDAAQSGATSELSALSGSAHIARASVTSALSGSAHTARGVVAQNADAAVSGLFASVQNVTNALDADISTEKGRIDAILSASVADTDSFAEIVSLINSVDTTNDSAFAGFVTSSNSRATAIEGSVTALSGSVLSVTNAIEGSVTALSSSAEAAREEIHFDTLNNKYGIQDLSSKIDNNEGEISSLDTEVKINTQNIQDAEYDLAINAQGIAANTSAIANLGSGFATDSELSGLSGSAHTARISGSLHEKTSRIAGFNTVEFVTDNLSELINQNSEVMGMNMQAIDGIYQTQLPALDGKISTEKGRIDAILSASVADSDSFAEIVSLINSVDTTNDQAFAGFVTSSNSRATAIEGSVTALSGSAAAANALIISDVSANSGSIATNNTNIANNTEFIQNVQTQTGQGFASINQSIAIQIDRISGSAEAANALIISDVSANSASIAALDGNYATDSSVTALSGSAHTARGVVASDATSATSALSSSANIARGVIAANAYNTTLAVSSSILVATDALDTRVGTLEGASHAHSNKANLDQINQDLGTSDNVNFNDLVVDGNLTVSGTTTTVNTANLLVEDKFILLNSGSADPDEGGIIIDEGAGSGHAFIYDKGDTRWGFNASVAQDASTANATAHAAAVVDMQNVAHNDSAEYQKVGNIKIDNGDIFIYTNTAVTTPIQSGDPFASEYKVYNGGDAGNFSYTDALGVFQSRYLSPGQDQMVCAKVDSIFSPIGMTVTLWSTFCPQMPSGGLVAL